MGLGNRAVTYLILAAQERCQQTAFAASWWRHRRWSSSSRLRLGGNGRSALFDGLKDD